MRGLNVAACREGCLPSRRRRSPARKQQRRNRGIPGEVPAHRSHSRAPEAGGSRARAVSRRLQVCSGSPASPRARSPTRVHPGDGREFVLVLILRPHRPAPALGGGSGRARSVSRQPVGIVIVRVQGSAHVQLSVRRLRGRHLRHRDGRFRRTCRHRPPATPRTVVAPRVELVELSADEFLMANNRLRC